MANSTMASAVQTGQYPKIILATILIILSGYLLIAAVNTGLGNAYYFKTKSYLSQWQKNKNINEQAYNQATSAIQKAIKYDPTNSYYALVHNSVTEWGHSKLGMPIEHNAHTARYTYAIAQRPLWPDSYAQYAYYLAFYAHNLATAWPFLLKANELGPYTPQVLTTSLQIALAYWPHLTISQKYHTYTVATKLAEFKAHQLVNLIKKHQQKSAFCQYFKYSKHTLSPKNKAYLLKHLC
jgi:hypothetical protein